jgi:hypothetical protein
MRSKPWLLGPTANAVAAATNPHEIMILASQRRAPNRYRWHFEDAVPMKDIAAGVLFKPNVDNTPRAKKSSHKHRLVVLWRQKSGVATVFS